MNFYLYTTIDSQPFELAPVKARSKSGASKAPVKFAPPSGDTATTDADGNTVARNLVSDVTLAAWLAASDADARTAILAEAKVTPVMTSSPIHPDADTFGVWRSGVESRAAANGHSASAQMVAELHAGYVILPAAARGSSAVKVSASERTVALAAELFPDEPEDESDTEDESTDDESEPTPEPTPSAGKRGK